MLAIYANGYTKNFRCWQLIKSKLPCGDGGADADAMKERADAVNAAERAANVKIEELNKEAIALYRLPSLTVFNAEKRQEKKRLRGLVLKISGEISELKNKSLNGITRWFNNSYFYFVVRRRILLSAIFIVIFL
jgi:hypothetical protein